jgi:hypothetical protein
VPELTIVETMPLLSLEALVAESEIPPTDVLNEKETV